MNQIMIHHVLRMSFLISPIDAKFLVIVALSKRGVYQLISKISWQIGKLSSLAMQVYNHPTKEQPPEVSLECLVEKRRQNFSIGYCVHFVGTTLQKMS